MYIENHKIHNYRGVNNVNFKLDSKLNLFVGVNGSGKTTILDSITIALSWLINRIQRENSSGKHISESDIRNSTPYSSIETIIKKDSNEFNWSITKTQRGESQVEKSNLKQVSDLAEYFRKQLKYNKQLPVIAYYPVNRLVKDTAPELSSRENYSILDVYDNAIGVKANYQSFFEWFRIQDDILNENLGSRTKWMINNKKWLKAKIDKSISKLTSLTKNQEEFKYFTERIKNDDLIFEEPRFLFRELIHILHTVEFKFQKSHHFEKILHDIEFLIHIISSVSEKRKDSLIDKEKILFHIRRVFEQIEDISHDSKLNDDYNILIAFIWELFLFSILLSFWWLSDIGKSEIENLFKEYELSGQNDFKNWDDINKSFLNNIEQIIGNDTNRQDLATKNQGREIQIVTKTIEKFIEGYSNLRIKRTPRPHMLVDKNDETFNLEQLSDGEKNLIALVGDIARRLSIANPNSEDPLKGDGVILIDEVDLHLHPSWQRIIIPKLTQIFSNCQFFISTHSPQVLSHVKPENIFLLSNEKNELSYTKPIESYGKNTDRILEDILGVDARPKKQKEDLSEIYTLIHNNDLEEAKNKIKKLEELIGEDSELVKARVLIKRKEIIGK
ncbi:MAG: AAA family ATPase [Marinifilaceae bacterium]|jgi:predicted ATP-binding protein involved in virulence|nr:AAA family ATPase [Marinifilaceae bacterium]